MSEGNHTVAAISPSGIDAKVGRTGDTWLALTAHRMTCQRLMILVQLAGDACYRGVATQSHTADTNAVRYNRLLVAIESLEQHVTTRPCSTGETR